MLALKSRKVGKLSLYAQIGNFGLPWSVFSRNIHWIHCREIFHREYDFLPFLKGFYFITGGKDWGYEARNQKKENVIKFIEQAEKHLGVHFRTQFFDTDNEKVLWVKPGFFWRRQWMRMSLFTILLRASMSYDAKEDWRACLMRQTYARSTRPAIERFFDGYTFYTGYRRGWYRAFESPYVYLKWALVHHRIPIITRLVCNVVSFVHFLRVLIWRR